jgi:ribose transport system permease protein
MSPPASASPSSSLQPSVREPRRSVGKWLSRLGPLAALVVLMAITGAMEPTFLRPENLINILRQQSFMGIVAIGMTVVIIAGGIDLSVGALMAMSGGLGIWLMNTVLGAAKILADNAAARVRHAEDLKMGLTLPIDLPFSGLREAMAHGFQAVGMAGNPWAGLTVGLISTVAVATAAGFCNGLLIAKGRLAPFIATLSGLVAYRSLALSLADGGEFRAQGSLFGVPGTGGIDLPFVVRAATADSPAIRLQLPYPVIALGLVAVLVAFALRRTPFGRYVYAIGNNERAALYSAIAVDRVKIKVYTLMGTLVGIAACFLASRMNSVASSTTGNLTELDAIAAVVIGGTRMQGGSGGIGGTLIGVLILGVISNMLNLLNVSPYLQGLVKGLIIIAAVLLQSAGRRKG